MLYFEQMNEGFQIYHGMYIHMLFDYLLLPYINNTYIQELSLEEKRRQEILERFNKLKNK